MRRVLFGTIALLMMLWMGLSLAMNAQAINTATVVTRDEISVTLYNGGTAVVQDTRTFALTEGLNALEFTDVSRRLNQESTIVTSSEVSLRIIEQERLVEQRLDREALLRANMEATVSIKLRDDTEYTGTLISAGDPLLLRLDDETILSVSPGQIEEFRFPTLPGNSVTTPTLRVIVESDSEGEVPIALTYLTDGLAWSSTRYNMQLADQEDSVSLTGWVSLLNNTGVDFTNMDLTLATGNFNQLDFVARQQDNTTISATATAIAQINTTQAAQQQALPTSTLPPIGGRGNVAQGEQPEGVLFEINQPVTLNAGQNKLIEFLNAGETGAQNLFVYDASPRVFGFQGFNTNPTYGMSEVTTVQNFLEISTGEEGLDTALPAGQMRIYEARTAGAPLLIGETSIRYTPTDETLQLFLEASDDISGARLQTDFQIPSDDTVQETIEIRLRNQTDEAIEILVIERMTRGAIWEILGSSAPFEQPNNNSVEFLTEVPANDTAIISYTVLYRRS